MALPKLNDSPSYRMTIPSTGQEVSYRPYLVKEEKQMMIASETGDQKQIMETMARTIQACITEEFNINTLTTFDIEYMFTQIRSRSVGENVDIEIKCEKEECLHKTEVKINLTEARVDVPKVSNIIQLNEKISVEIRWPTYVDVYQNYKQDGSEVDFGFTMLERCIVAILTEDERFDTKDVNQKEVAEFLNSMTTQQLGLLSDFISQTPQLEKDVEWVCGSCGHENKYTIRGMQDFFS